MSSRPSRDPSPSNSPKPTHSRHTSVNPEASGQQPTTLDISLQPFAETPQHTTGILSPATPPIPDSAAPLIIITTGSPPESKKSPEESQAPESSRQGRSLVSRHQGSGTSSSQPARRSTTPYDRPRFPSQPRDITRTTTPTMSSAGSSPSNTSTSGPSTSGSIPGYAPFPYPMPAPPKGGSGK